jgi:uncharacterized membrane protein YgdD (TMEM256/DUF423 family)
MRLWLFIAAVNGFLAVAAGAFAAHALQARLDAHSLQLFETGTRYHIYHALALGLTALGMRPASAPATLAAASFLAGIILFSGSLYALSFTGARAFAFITPVGGLAFLLGWAALAWAAVRTTT